MELMTLKNITNMLRINKHRLDDELEVHPEIAYLIAEKVALLNSQQLVAKDDLSRVEGEVLLEIAADDEGKKGSNAATRQAEVLKDPDRKDAWNKYMNLKREFETWSGLNDAWKSRGFALKTLADLHIGSYYSPSSTSGRDSSYNRPAPTEVNSRPARRRVAAEE